MAMSADQWNEQYPVGTPVIAYPGVRPEHAAGGWDTERVETKTRTVAWTAHGKQVVMVEGYSSWIDLDHVDPVTSGQ